MTENPDYWNTIATVIPVLALTYAAALKRRDWHELKPPTRRWTALYGAAVVGALAWAEWVSLNYLQQKSTSALDEGITLIVVGSVALQVLAVPIAPLVVLAIHDLHPKVVRAKKSLKSDIRDLAKIRREYDEVVTWIEQTAYEYRLEGLEQILKSPHLVFGEHGAVVPGYQDRIVAWQMQARLAADTDAPRREAEDKFRISVRGRG